MQVYQLLTMNYVEDDEAMFRCSPLHQEHLRLFRNHMVLSLKRLSSVNSLLKYPFW